MIPLTEDSLFDAILKIKIEDARDRPTRIVIPNKLLRLSILIFNSRHLKFMYKQSPRNARKRSKARQHQSFITPRWAI